MRKDLANRLDSSDCPGELKFINTTWVTTVCRIVRTGRKNSRSCASLRRFSYLEFRLFLIVRTWNSSAREDRASTRITCVTEFLTASLELTKAAIAVSCLIEGK